ncbi:hypothetical protein P3S67_028855 [Capsicum chacoense]
MTKTIPILFMEKRYDRKNSFYHGSTYRNCLALKIVDCAQQKGPKSVFVGSASGPSNLIEEGGSAKEGNRLAKMGSRLGETEDIFFSIPLSICTRWKTF